MSKRLGGIIGGCGKPVAPVVHLVVTTSKPSDVGMRVRISAQSHELRFFFTKIKIKNENINKIMPNKSTSAERLKRVCTKLDFTVDEGKGRG